MTNDRTHRALLAALAVFAGSVGLLTTAALVFAVLDYAARAAGALAAAGVGATVSIPLAARRRNH